MNEEINSTNRELWAMTSICHNANLAWGNYYGNVVDGARFEDLSKEDKIKKVENMRNARVTDSRSSHETWLKTCPKNHPCNKPYEELRFEDKAKDILFTGMVRILKNVEELKNAR